MPPSVPSVPLLIGPKLIGHRGASGYRPEHTLASYELAIAQGADYIEPDVVPTRDGRLVARHENEISGTTDVAEHPEFSDRRTTKDVDGRRTTGWFTEDFTLDELLTLRARERLPALRPANVAYDDRFTIPTLEEVIALARRSRTPDGRPVGVAPETKHPSYFAALGLALEQPLVDALHAGGFTEADDPVLVQSFETANLRELAGLTRLPLIQLVDHHRAPWDLTLAGDPRTYADLVTPAGLAGIREYAAHVALSKDLVIPRTADGRLGAPTAVVEHAHAAGLQVTAWTFRRENQFLPVELRVGDDPAAPGDLDTELRTFFAAGLDAFFTDQPDVGYAARLPRA